MPIIDPSGSSTPAESNFGFEQNVTDTSDMTDPGQTSGSKKRRNASALYEAENEKFNAVCDKLLAADDGDQKTPYKNYGKFYGVFAPINPNAFLFLQAK